MRNTCRRRPQILPLLGCASLIVLATGSAIAQPSDCSHIRILDRSNADEVHSSLRDVIAPASRAQRRVVRDAFAVAPPLVCQAVQRVVFVDDSASPGVAGRNKVNDRQDLLYFNIASPKFMEFTLSRGETGKAHAMQTVLHEATHAATRLLYSRSTESPPALLEERPPEDLWSAGALNMADETLANTRMEKGLFQEWERLHNSFSSKGLANHYYGDGWKEILGETPGFASAYGGENIKEDIAEIASWAMLSKHFSTHVESGTYPEWNRACLGMRKLPGPAIPANQAAVFAKVGFAHSLGLISDDQYSECVGNLKIRGNGSGFFTFVDGQQTRQYAGDVKGRIGQIGNDDEWFFELEAQGSINIEDKGNKPAKIRLTLKTSHDVESIELVSFPRGLYHIGPGHGPFNTVQITYTDEGDNKIAIEIHEADILISRASRKLIEGTVFIKKIINYTELIKLPVAPKKPQIITFRKENQETSSQ